MGIGIFQQLKSGLSRAHKGFVGKLDSLFTRSRKLDEEMFEQLEEILIESDIGPRMSGRILGDLRTAVKTNKVSDSAGLKALLQAEMIKLLKSPPAWNHNSDGPTIILIIGINGVGKTTTIAKLANHFLKQKKKVLLAAGDTFRAAAIDQLKIWAERLGVDCIAHQDGSDAAAVCFDAVTAAKARQVDILIIDTAGRLHTKAHLVEELKKIKRSIQKVEEGAPHETLLVLDATTGQNGLLQAQVFYREVDTSGLILTKMDGTAKGGVALTVSNELSLPIRFIGLGEKIDDLTDFNPREFITALFEA